MSETQKSPMNGPILSLIAIVISLSALGVSVFEVTSIKDQQKASVWPYLEIEGNYSSEGYEVLVTNKGIGPALLGDVVFMHEGDRIATAEQLDALIAEQLGPERAFSYDTYRVRNISNSVLSPGEKVLLFGVPWTKDTQAFLEAVGETMTSEGCYCSVYEDCWSVSSNALPERIKSCR